MFSSIFGKRRSSPVEDDTPPIPGPKVGDSFVIVNPSPPGGSLYPSVPGAGVPGYPVAPSRPAPPAPVQNPSVENFHYLQGVPFSLCRELQMANNKDAFATEISDLLAFLTNKVNISSYNYDFSIEKSVLKEC